MQALAQGNFSTQQVDDALHGVSGQRTLTFQYNLLDSGLNPKKILSYCSAGSITWDSTQAIRRTLSFTMRDDPAVLWGSDLVQPYVLLTMPNSGGQTVWWPQGVFLLSSPTRALSAGGQLIRQVQGYDRCQQANDAKLVQRLAINAGNNYVTQVQNLLTGIGITQQNVTPWTGNTTPAGREWAPGTPTLQVIDDLLSAINYYPLWFDPSGTAQVQPYVLPPSRPLAYTLANDARSVLGMGSSDSLDYFGVPNQFLVAITQPDRTVASTVYQITSAANPVSYVNRGNRWITTQVTPTDAVDGSTLATIAQRIAYNASQVFETFSLQTALLPVFDEHDIIQLNYARFGVSQSYELRSFTMPLVAGQMMTLQLRALNPLV